MNNKYLNANQAHWRIYDLLVAEDAVVATIPAFKRIRDAFGANLAALKQKDSGRPGLTEGKTDAKLDSEYDLVKALVVVADAVYNHAVENSLVELEHKSSTTEAALSGLRDTGLSEKADAILNLTTGIETDLVEHGLTAEKLADAKTKLAAYNMSLTDRDQGETQSVAATKSVAQLMHENSAIVANRFRRYVNQLEDDYPDFCARYHAAKRIVKLGGKRKDKKGGDTGDAPQPPDNPS